MGAGAAFIIWMVLLGALAVPSAAILRRVTRWLLRNAPAERDALARFAARLPYACIAIAAASYLTSTWVFDAYGVDARLGDDWHVPLSHGYRLAFVDVPDVAFVEGERQFAAAMWNIDAIQLAGERVYAHEAAHPPGFPDAGVGHEQFALFDLATGQRTEVTSLDALREAARSQGVVLALERPIRLYERLRPAWLDRVFSVMLLVPVPAAFMVLAWRIRRARARARRGGAGAET